MVMRGSIVWHGDEPEPPPGWWEDWRLLIVLVALFVYFAGPAIDYDADHAAKRDAHRIERLKAMEGGR